MDDYRKDPFDLQSQLIQQYTQSQLPNIWPTNFGITAAPARSSDISTFRDIAERLSALITQLGGPAPTDAEYLAPPQGQDGAGPEIAYRTYIDRLIDELEWRSTTPSKRS